MGGGGNAQSGETRYDWNPTIGGYWGGAPGADGRGGGGVLGWAAEEAMRPYQSYGNGASRVAGFNNDQYTGQQRMRNLADSGGPQDTARARMSAGEIAAGNQLNANPYMGQSPYFDTMLKSGMEDITNAYKQGTSADTTRMFNMSGAFGGSAHQNAVANNEGALAKQLGQYATGMQNAQYDRSGNLMESALGRQMGAIPLAFQGQGLSTDLIDRLNASGATQQGLQQRQMDDRLGQWNEEMNWGRNNVSWLASLLGGAQGSTGIQSSQSGYQGVNPGAAIGAAGLLGRAGGLF